MAGLYLHIPFCKQACHYCNFHFSTSLKYRSEMVQAMLYEMDLQKEYLGTRSLDSIYLGGGTPSILEPQEIDQLFEKIFATWKITPDAEITLEANPDDLSPEKLSYLKASPINRLSIGIQSFSEQDLQFMNRAHNAQEAERCIQMAQDAGFQQLTVDLIYGSPTTSDAQWAENIEKVLQHEVPHISCYCLTVEPKTALDHFVRNGKAEAVDEVQANRQFEYLMNRLDTAQYEHYEISNFALPGNFAQHNSNYWRGVPYLGIGPAAHSYNQDSRQWNIANNAKYLRIMLQGEQQSWYEKEELSPENRYNEYVMTRLRTSWGVDLQDLDEPYRAYFLAGIEEFISKKQVFRNDQIFRLSPSGKLLADYIAMELFY